MSRRSGSWVRCSLVTFAIVSALCVCGPALYWRFNKSVTVSDSPSSCSPCHCNCPEPVSLQIYEFPIPEHSVMAQLPVDSNPAPQEAGEEQQLKHLEFVQEAVPRALLYFSKLYNVAKEKSGPLKPGVQTVEGTINSIVEPVYQKFQDIPVKVIKYIDDKVDESMTSLKDVVFPAVTQVTGVACSVATEVKKAGVVDTATALAKSVYTKYVPAAMELAERCAVSSWHRLNQLSVFPKVDESMTSLKDIVPPAVTQETGVACYVATEVKKAGVVDTATALAKSVYTKYVPAAMELAERCAVSSWHRLNQLSVFPKVDESMTSLKDVVPPAVTQVTGVACSVVTEVKKAGVVATAHAKSVYTKYVPAAMELAERCAVSSWHRLNQLIVFPKVAQAVLPTATYCTEKYNQMVQLTADKGYKVASYLPLVPTEKIAKIFDLESNPAAAAAH
ncbi:unnamed protein product [Rhodiola kirilowii]